MKTTCSMGVVQLEEEEYKMAPDQAGRYLIKRGDERIYQAKRQGKNLVVFDCKEA